MLSLKKHLNLNTKYNFLMANQFLACFPLYSGIHFKERGKALLSKEPQTLCEKQCRTCTLASIKRITAWFQHGCNKQLWPLDPQLLAINIQLVQKLSVSLQITVSDHQLPGNVLFGISTLIHALVPFQMTIPHALKIDVIAVNLN